MLDSFKYAFRGIWDALKCESNLRVHFLASIAVIILAIYLNFDQKELSILILTISFIIILELINTIVEKLVDIHSLKVSEEARVIKDMSAGVVLLGAIASIMIGLLLFLPKLFS